MNILAVCIGGCIGAISRYLLQTFLNKRLPVNIIPLSILIINLVGSFGLGVFIPRQQELTISSYLFVATGFFGALTTFSTFSTETLSLLEKQGFMKALIYMVLSIIGCIFIFFIGNIVGMSLL